MANQINIPQFQGSQQVNRQINPTAGDILGFNSTTAKLETRPPTTDPGTGFNTPTLLSPTITGASISGVVVAKKINFVEDAASVSHTASVAIPAGATLHDIIIDAGVLWGAGAATMDVGDTASATGYFSAINLKATDLLVGEQIRITSSELWGGKQGAYLVAATGRRGPTSSNFGGKYVAGSNITFQITVTTPAVTTGRTYATVTYSVGETAAVVTV